MAEASRPSVFSIAAHRGFADALVAGLVERYLQPETGLARLTLLVPSARAARTISEAFVRHSGQTGLLMPRMVTVGDLDLDESLGSLLDPLGAADIPPAVDPYYRLLSLASLIEEEFERGGRPPVGAAARLRLAREMARTMDRLLVENVDPQELFGDRVLDLLEDLSGHWRRSLHIFMAVQARWRAQLDEIGRVDAATRRNMLFERAARKWKAEPPSSPIVAAGVTSAAPALARMLRAIADLPDGAVVLPDLDLSMDQAAWDELGRAGASEEPGGEVFARGDALTHPQYHLKLLLGRMGISREEVEQWHRKGMTAAEPARTHAISSLFLPPEASRSWIDLEADRRRLGGVRLMTCGNIEEEAQAIALLVREALEIPEKRVAVVTADRMLARRVVQHLERWNIKADDSAGRPLSLTPAGRLLALLAQLISDGFEPALVVGTLAHPLVHRDDPEERRLWLRALRRFDRKLRGPAPASGLEPLRTIAKKAGVEAWFERVEAIIARLDCGSEPFDLADALDLLATTAEALAGDAMWAREDGRELASLIEELRLHARAQPTLVEPADLSAILRDAMDAIAVRPPYGGHPRVSIYGLLESRMARADLMICGGLNEGSWPQPPGADPLLAPAVLRALGVPGSEFRIGLSAHDLAGALGAPEVVLSRARRDGEGPTLASRFWLRVEALMGERLADRHRETKIPAMLSGLDRAPGARVSRYPRPRPSPSPELRQVSISATALDRLLGDPYQFYARQILGLKPLDPLAADPFGDAALRGTLVHDILDRWHKARRDDPKLPIIPFAEGFLRDKRVHPLFWGLWRPRINAALERFEEMIETAANEGRTVLATETPGEMTYEGVKVHGKADRIDRLADGTLAIVDYKTGKPPSGAQVEAGFALQLGVLGLIARDGKYDDKKDGISGEPTEFAYWSLAREQNGRGFGYVAFPMKLTERQSGVLPEDFIPHHEERLRDAITRFIKGDEPFTARLAPDYKGYNDYDQLMRLDEWIVELTEPVKRGEP